LAGLSLVLATRLSAQWAPPAPNPATYSDLFDMIGNQQIPWPHGRTQPAPRRNLTPQELIALGKKYFGSLPSTQNSTIVATIVYVWSQPTYRLANFPLVAMTRNLTALGDMITYLPVNDNPWVPAMFGLSGQTDADVIAELLAQNETVYRQCESFAMTLAYGLSNLPPVTYKNVPMLYRGDGRNTVYFCNQFGEYYGYSVDECVAMLFAPGSELVVSSFWSSTPDITITSHYEGSVIYYIQPNPQRTSWHARDINDFNIDMSAHEHLYSSNAKFTVVNLTCAGYYWNVTLMEQGDAGIYRPTPRPPPMTIPRCVN